MKESLVLISLLLMTFKCFSTINMQERFFKGYFIYGHEVSEFKECMKNEVLWLNANIDDLRRLTNISEFLAQKDKQPYPVIYIEFRGYRVMREPVGFEANYDGIIRLSELTAIGMKKGVNCGSF